MRRIACQFFFCTLITSVLLCGCEKSPPPQFRLNAVEMLKQEKIALADDESFDPKYKKEVGNILTALFGTPNEPKFPFLLGEDDDAHQFISLDNLKLAAGSVHRDPSGNAISGLYRQHCAHCHGISGDGAGPTAATLNPYPRDFRLAKIKFKSSPLRQMPTDDDMVEILRNGIPGTAMPSFRTLPDQEIKALIDYVKYLTIRGQYERFLLSELSTLDGESLLNMESYRTIKNWTEDKELTEQEEELQDGYLDQIDQLFLDGLIDTYLAKWVDREDGVTDVPDPPDTIAADHPGHADLVTKGRALFHGKGNCAQCHGENAAGDGQTNTFDEWTKDWANTAPGVDPFDSSTYQDFIAAGALKPRPIRPRNLRHNVYRGGGHPEDLYLRILNGIEGTPMPSGATLQEDEIWALVAFVKALPFEDDSKPAAPKKVNNQPIAR